MSLFPAFNREEAAQRATCGGLRRHHAKGLGYPPPQATATNQRPQPDWAAIHRELRRPGVTLQLLWEEHRGTHPDGYGYSRYCELYRAWEGRLSPTMRQLHVAGERMFGRSALLSKPPHCSAGSCSAGLVRNSGRAKRKAHAEPFQQRFQQRELISIGISSPARSRFSNAVGLENRPRQTASRRIRHAGAFGRARHCGCARA